MIKLKTNIKCGACIATVTPKLNELPDTKWEVDLNHQDKILTVEGNVSEEAVKSALESAGYKGETI